MMIARHVSAEYSLRVCQGDEPARARRLVHPQRSLQRTGEERVGCAAVLGMWALTMAHTPAFSARRFGSCLQYQTTWVPTTIAGMAKGQYLPSHSSSQPVIAKWPQHFLAVKPDVEKPPLA